jgi:hypothetical protein
MEHQNAPFSVKRNDFRNKRLQGEVLSGRPCHLHSFQEVLKARTKLPVGSFATLGFLVAALITIEDYSNVQTFLIKLAMVLDFVWIHVTTISIA